MSFYPNRPSIYSAIVTETTVEIVFRRSPDYMFAVCGPNATPPDEVWAQVWVVEDGKLFRLPDKQGIHTPSLTVPETITFSP